MAEAPNKRQRSARIQKNKEEAAMASAEASEDAKATEAEELADALRIVDALKASENGCYKTKIAVAVSLSFVSLDEELTALKLKGATEQRGEEEQQEQEARLEVKLDDEDDEEEKSPRIIPPDEFATFDNELEEEGEVHDTIPPTMRIDAMTTSPPPTTMPMTMTTTIAKRRMRATLRRQLERRKKEREHARWRMLLKTRRLL